MDAPFPKTVNTESCISDVETLRFHGRFSKTCALRWPRLTLKLAWLRCATSARRELVGFHAAKAYQWKGQSLHAKHHQNSVIGQDFLENFEGFCTYLAGVGPAFGRDARWSCNSAWGSKVCLQAVGRGWWWVMGYGCWRLFLNAEKSFKYIYTTVHMYTYNVYLCKHVSIYTCASVCI